LRKISKCRSNVYNLKVTRRRRKRHPMRLLALTPALRHTASSALHSSCRSRSSSNSSSSRSTTCDTHLTMPGRRSWHGMVPIGPGLERDTSALIFEDGSEKKACRCTFRQESRAVARRSRDAAAVLFGLKFADDIHCKFKSSQTLKARLQSSKHTSAKKLTQNDDSRSFKVTCFGVSGRR